MKVAAEDVAGEDVAAEPAAAEGGAPAAAARRRRRRWLGAAGLLAALGLAGWSLQRQFGALPAAAVGTALRGQPVANVLAALALTAVSFVALAAYDVLAAAVAVPGRVPRRVAWLAGASANAVSNTLGFHAVTASLVRARLYLRAGFGAADVARIVSLSWLALGLGFVTMLCGAELFRGWRGGGAALATGMAVAAGLALLVAWLARAPRRLAWCGFNQPLPSARLALAQMAIGAVESAAAVGALYVLLPADLAPPFDAFAVGCIAAVALGLVAHVPGGVGVFEAGITALLGGAGRADLLAALLLYRVVYNLLPFLLAVAALAWSARPAFNSNAGRP